MLTRSGFFLLCMSASGVKARECRKAFARVYEISLNFAISMKAKVTREISSMDNKKDAAEKRIHDKVREKTEGGKISTLKKKIIELEEENKLIKEDLKSIKTSLELKTIAYNDSDKKRMRLEEVIEEKVQKISRLKEKKIKYMNLYKELKIDRDTIIIHEEKIERCADKKTAVKEILKFDAKKIDKQPMLLPEIYTEKSLSIKSISDLKNICRTKYICGYSNKCKADLIKYMLDHKKLYIVNENIYQK